MPTQPIHSFIGTLSTNQYRWDQVPGDQELAYGDVLTEGTPEVSPEDVYRGRFNPDNHLSDPIGFIILALAGGRAATLVQRYGPDLGRPALRAWRRSPQPSIGEAVAQVSANRRAMRDAQKKPSGPIKLKMNAIHSEPLPIP